MGELLQPWHIIILAITFAVYVAFLLIPFWQIFKKAGFPPFFALLMMVPFVNLVMLYVLAFAKWKVAPSS